MSEPFTRRLSERRAPRPGLLLPLLLGLGVILSALLVVQMKNDNRRLTNESTQLRDEHDRLEVEWSQLQLEEAAHSSHSRIETIARRQLKMVEPRETVMVQGGAAVSILGVAKAAPETNQAAAAGVSP